MGNDQQKPVRRVASLPSLNHSSSVEHQLNSSFKRRSGRSSKRYRHDPNHTRGNDVPNRADVIRSAFIPEYPHNTSVNETSFEILHVIAQGAFGDVIKVCLSNDDNGRTYAMKVMNKQLVVTNEAIGQCKAEAAIHFFVGNHPFIVTPHHTFQNHDNVYLVMDYITRGELFSAWKHFRSFSEQIVQIYVAEIALVLDYLHRLGIIYRDLKMENVLIDHRGHLKVIDFGLAKWLKRGEKTWTICGTLQYIAPEVLTNQAYTHSIDWWSLGILMYTLLVGEYPIGGESNHVDMAKRVKSHVYDLPIEFSLYAKQLIRKLLRRDPLERIHGASALQREPFFRDINFDTLLSKSNTDINVRPSRSRSYDELDSTTNISQNLQTLSRDNGYQSPTEDTNIQSQVNPEYRPIQRNKNNRSSKRRSRHRSGGHETSPRGGSQSCDDERSLRHRDPDGGGNTANRSHGDSLANRSHGDNAYSNNQGNGVLSELNHKNRENRAQGSRNKDISSNHNKDHSNSKQDRSAQNNKSHRNNHHGSNKYHQASPPSSQQQSSPSSLHQHNMEKLSIDVSRTLHHRSHSADNLTSEHCYENLPQLRLRPGVNPGGSANESTSLSSQDSNQLHSSGRSVRSSTSPPIRESHMNVRGQSSTSPPIREPRPNAKFQNVTPITKSQFNNRAHITSSPTNRGAHLEYSGNKKWSSPPIRESQFNNGGLNPTYPVSESLLKVRVQNLNSPAPTETHFTDEGQGATSPPMRTAHFDAEKPKTAIKQLKIPHHTTNAKHSPLADIGCQRDWNQPKLNTPAMSVHEPHTSAANAAANAATVMTNNQTPEEYVPLCETSPYVNHPVRKIVPTSSPDDSRWGTSIHIPESDMYRSQHSNNNLHSPRAPTQFSSIPSHGPTQQNMHSPHDSTQQHLHSSPRGPSLPSHTLPQSSHNEGRLNKAADTNQNTEDDFAGFTWTHGIGDQHGSFV